MPIYEYRAKGKGCPKCLEGFEMMLAINDRALEACPECKGPVDQIISKIGRIDVAYTPSDAFKHYTRQMEKRQNKMETEGKTKEAEE